MITMKWDEVLPSESQPRTGPTKESPRFSSGSPRILRSATTPTSPNPIPQRHCMLSTNIASPTIPSPKSGSPASLHALRSRTASGVGVGSPRSARGGSPSVSSRKTSSILTTAPTSIQSETPAPLHAKTTVKSLMLDMAQIPLIATEHRK